MDWLQDQWCSCKGGIGNLLQKKTKHLEETMLIEGKIQFYYRQKR